MIVQIQVRAGIPHALKPVLPSSDVSVVSHSATSALNALVRAGTWSQKIGVCQARSWRCLKFQWNSMITALNVTGAKENLIFSVTQPAGTAVLWYWRGDPVWGLTKMNERPQQAVGVRARKNPSERLNALRDPTARKTKIQDITEALISSGYTSLDRQAKALGLHRSTAWTIIRSRHKLGRLSTKTIERIITNPETPPLVLTAIQEYAVEIYRSEIEN